MPLQGIVCSTILPVNSSFLLFFRELYITVWDVVRLVEWWLFSFGTLKYVPCFYYIAATCTRRRVAAGRLAVFVIVVVGHAGSGVGASLGAVMSECGPRRGLDGGLYRADLMRDV